MNIFDKLDNHMHIFGLLKSIIIFLCIRIYVNSKLLLWSIRIALNKMTLFLLISFFMGLDRKNIQNTSESKLEPWNSILTQNHENDFSILDNLGGAGFSNDQGFHCTVLKHFSMGLLTIEIYCFTVI